MLYAASWLLKCKLPNNQLSKDQNLSHLEVHASCVLIQMYYLLRIFAHVYHVPQP
jgi:hypothetical protein